MLIPGLLGMYFDAAVVFVKKSSLLFRLAVAILCLDSLKKRTKVTILSKEDAQNSEFRSFFGRIETINCN
jgi:hypothetical protein